MWSVTTIHSKLVLLGIASLGIITAVVAVLARVFSAGKTAAKAQDMKETLNQKAMETQVNAEIAATSAAVKRKQLLDRWSKH